MLTVAISEGGNANTMGTIKAAAEALLSSDVSNAVEAYTPYRSPMSPAGIEMDTCSRDISKAAAAEEERRRAMTNQIICQLGCNTSLFESLRHAKARCNH